MFNRKPSGFTLLELLVVISIIAILAVSLTPAFSRAREEARRSQCRDSMKQIHGCLIMYETSEGMFPAFLDGAGGGTTTSAFQAAEAQKSLNLLYRQYTDDARIFSCSSKPVDKAKLEGLVPAKGGTLTGSSFAESTGAGGGSTGSSSYGYAPAHSSNASQVIVLADHKGAQANSDNHGKNAGQNVLSAGGSVKFTNAIVNFMGLDEDSARIEDPNIFTFDGGSGGSSSVLTPELDSFCK